MNFDFFQHFLSNITPLFRHQTKSIRSCVWIDLMVPTSALCILFTVNLTGKICDSYRGIRVDDHNTIFNRVVPETSHSMYVCFYNPRYCRSTSPVMDAESLTSELNPSGLLLNTRPGPVAAECIMHTAGDILAFAQHHLLSFTNALWLGDRGFSFDGRTGSG